MTTEPWRPLAIAGGIVALVGVLAIAFPFVSGVSIAFALGALLVVAGIAHGYHAFTAGGWRGSAWQAVLAIVSIVAGIVVLANPVLGLASLTLVAIAYLLVDGAAELWMAARASGRTGRGWIAASGAVSLVLAALLWVGFPASALWAVGVLVGASLLATGLSMVLVAVAARDLEGDAVPPGTEPRVA